MIESYRLKVADMGVNLELLYNKNCSLSEITRLVILAYYEHTGLNISKTAKMLHITRSTVYKYLGTK